MGNNTDTNTNADSGIITVADIAAVTITDTNLTIRTCYAA
jgi:hypothetical protein